MSEKEGSQSPKKDNTSTFGKAVAAGDKEH